MKHFSLIITSLLICLFSAAQNGGQAPQNTALNIRSYAADSLQVHNITGCQITFITNDNRTFSLSANDSVRFFANRATKIKVKDVAGNCKTDFGWVEAGLILSSMPVTFGQVISHKNSQYITINWTTLVESNVSHFTPQISNDGLSWQGLEDVKPNAKMVYSYRHNNKTTYIAMLSVFGLLIAFLKKKNKMLLLLAPLLVLTGTIISCTKESAVVNDESSPVFVRIAQYDIDGTVSYSKVVKAITD